MVGVPCATPLSDSTWILPLLAAMSSLLSPTPILQLLTICFLSLLCAVSAQAEGGTIIPRSEISKEAYQRLEPQLEEEMQKKNMHLGQPIFMRIFKEEKELEVWVKKPPAGASCT